MAKAQVLQQKQKRPEKMAKLPSNARVTKRPLFHSAIPSPYTNAEQQKVVYLSTNTPFISAVKRVRQLLREADKRAMQSAQATSKMHVRRERQMAEEIVAEGCNEEVMIKATGRAIEKALNLALYFQGQKDCSVAMRTSSTWSIDDINTGPDAKGGKETRGADENMEIKGNSKKRKVDDDIPESRIRSISVLEVGVTMKR